MFFYTSLFVAGLIVALLILWLYNAILDVGKQVYRAILPSSKSNVTRHVQEIPLHTTINDTVAKTRAAKPSKATPWGWPGNKNEVQGHGPATSWPNGSKTEASLAGNGEKPKSAQKVGWPYREEEFEFAGKSYKVSRKVKKRKTNLSKTGKPWGW